MRIEYSIIIHRPVDEVFTFATDLQNERQWQPEIESLELPPEKPLRVGSVFTEVRRTFGRRYTWRFQVTAFEPGKIFRIESVAGTMPYKGSRLFEAVPEGTRLTEVGELQTSGIFKLFDPLMVRLATKSQDIAFHRLKALLEAR
jgi:uncharacterized membrane protein